MMFGGGGGLRWPRRSAGLGRLGPARSPGIPHELQDGVDELLATEPEYAEPDIVFSQNSSERELKRLSLWRLLTKYPGMLALAGVLVVVVAVASQVGPKLTEYAINNGMTPRATSTSPWWSGRPSPTWSSWSSPRWPSASRSR